MLKNGQVYLKILRYSQRKIFKVSMTISKVIHEEVILTES